MKVEKVEPIPVMKIYDVTSFTCTVPASATPDETNTFDIEDEVEREEEFSPIDIKNMTATEINDQLTASEIPQILSVSLAGGRVLDGASGEL